VSGKSAKISAFLNQTARERRSGRQKKRTDADRAQSFDFESGFCQENAL